jgi:topoisomerase-4 subunit A
MFCNLSESGINLINLFSDSENVKMLNIINVKNFTEALEILFITKNGLVKKTRLEEFSGDYSIGAAYKLKTEDDMLIAVEHVLENENKDLLLVTKKALGIRFKASDIPAMGKVASGVIGISLRDEDEAVFAALISQYKAASVKRTDEIALSASEEGEIVLLTNKKNKLNIKLEQVKQQNRAGKGVSLTMLVFDEQIKEGKINQ